MTTTRLMLAAALMATVSLPALAATTDDAVQNKKAVCAKQLTDNEKLLSDMRAARPNKAAMQALLDAALLVTPGSPICLADLLGEGDDDIGEMLAGKLADADNANIETAAGPEDETPGDLGETTEGGGDNGENAEQLGGGTNNTTPASPSAPTLE